MARYKGWNTPRVTVADYEETAARAVPGEVYAGAPVALALLALALERRGLTLRPRGFRGAEVAAK